MQHRIILWGWIHPTHPFKPPKPLLLMFTLLPEQWSCCMSHSRAVSRAVSLSLPLTFTLFEDKCKHLLSPAVRSVMG